MDVIHATAARNDVEAVGAIADYGVLTKTPSNGGGGINSSLLYLWEDLPNRCSGRLPKNQRAQTQAHTTRLRPGSGCVCQFDSPTQLEPQFGNAKGAAVPFVHSFSP